MCSSDLLDELGEHNPSRHVLVGRSGAVTDIGGWGAQDTVIFSRKPLSDSQISKILGQQGMVVARRTVAKYRESLQILPGNLRKTL